MKTNLEFDSNYKNIKLVERFIKFNNCFAKGYSPILEIFTEKINLKYKIPMVLLNRFKGDNGITRDGLYLAYEKHIFKNIKIHIILYDEYHNKIRTVVNMKKRRLEHEN